jgi:hypothetical protein
MYLVQSGVWLIVKSVVHIGQGGIKQQIHGDTGESSYVALTGGPVVCLVLVRVWSGTSHFSPGTVDSVYEGCDKSGVLCPFLGWRGATGEVATWLILPVVIRSSQRLSHARLSINISLWNCEWLIISVIVYLIVPYYLDNRSNSRANTCVNTLLG